jgi:hypothetical protein
LFRKLHIHIKTEERKVGREQGGKKRERGKEKVRTSIGKTYSERYSASL